MIDLGAFLLMIFSLNSLVSLFTKTVLDPGGVISFFFFYFPIWNIREFFVLYISFLFFTPPKYLLLVYDPLQTSILVFSYRFFFCICFIACLAGRYGTRCGQAGIP